jgi:hypothetical protein
MNAHYPPSTFHRNLECPVRAQYHGPSQQSPPKDSRYWQSLAPVRAEMTGRCRIRPWPRTCSSRNGANSRQIRCQPITLLLTAIILPLKICKMSVPLERLLSNYESCSATESDGEMDVSQSHDRQSKTDGCTADSKALLPPILSWLSCADGDEWSSFDYWSADEEEGRRQVALMDQRNERIRKRKLARRKVYSSEEEDGPAIAYTLQKKNPYRTLSMQQLVDLLWFATTDSYFKFQQIYSRRNDSEKCQTLYMPACIPLRVQSAV